MSGRPGTFRLTLPNGEEVTCWRRDAAAIRADILLTENVFLNRDPLTGVYERIDPASVQAARLTPTARRVGP